MAPRLCTLTPYTGDHEVPVIMMLPSPGSADHDLPIMIGGNCDGEVMITAVTVFAVGKMCG
jgi:hypothetical protein